MSAQAWTEQRSPSRTRMLLRATEGAAYECQLGRPLLQSGRGDAPRFIWILPSSTSSDERQMRTVSLRFLPLCEVKADTKARAREEKGEDEEGEKTSRREGAIACVSALALSRARAQARSPRWWRSCRRSQSCCSRRRARSNLTMARSSRRADRGEKDDVLDEDGVAPEEAEKLHRRRVERADRVVITRRLLDDQTVGTGRVRKGA